MNYLINLTISILIFYSSELIANDNEIIFEVNNKIYSTIDLKNRIIYLEEMNRTKYASILEKELKNDFFNSIIFFQYAINNNKLNTILIRESKKIFEKFKIDYNLSNNLKDEVILTNINYDYAKKIVLEDMLGNYREYIFSGTNDIRIIYS